MKFFTRVKMLDSFGGVVGKVTLKQNERGNFSLETRYTAQIAKQFAHDLNYLVTEKIYNTRTKRLESLDNFYSPNNNVNWINDDMHARLCGMELPLYYYNESDLMGFPDLVREFDKETAQIGEIAERNGFSLHFNYR